MERLTMRHLLAALLALTLAAPASAVRVAVWRQGTLGSTGAEGVAKFEGAMREVLDDLGVDYDFLSQDVARTCPTCPAANLWTSPSPPLKSGVVTMADGKTTRTYGAQIFLGWRVDGVANGTSMSRFNPDTLTLTPFWPDIPSAFFGLTTVNSASLYTATATCVTGTRTSTSMAPFGSFPWELTENLVGTPLVWKEGHSEYYARNANALTLDFATTPGVLRSRVSVASSSVAYRTNGKSSCTDCDSIPRAANQWTAPADTSIIWTRQRDVNDKTWLIFAPGLYCGNDGNNLPAASMSRVIALLDTATGGKVIGQKPGWQPKKIAFGISRAFTRSNSADGTDFGHGVQCGINGLCDTTTIKAAIDSIASLNIPVTVWCATDSIEAYPYEKAWWTKLTNAEFAPQVAAQMGTTVAVNAGNASSTFHVDPFGHSRARVPISNSRFENGGTCDGTDTTTSCLLTYARSRLDSIPGFGGRMSRALLTRFYDYIPSNFNRDQMPTNMEAAMLRAGYDHAVVNSLAIESNASWSAALTGAGGAAIPNAFEPGAPWAFSGRTYTRRIFNSTGGLIGDFMWCAARPFDETIIDETGSHGGGGQLEVMCGFLLNDWYQTPNTNRPFYLHTFRTRLPVVVVRAGDLGYRAASTSNPSMPGWFLVKHMVNSIRSINAMAGREVYRIVHVDEL